MNWDSITDEEMLIEMDDFGDSHTTIHEAAKRIRAKNARIAALEAEAARGRAEALREAEKIAGNVARLEAGMERRDGYMAASDIEHRISLLRTTAASQLETEAEVLSADDVDEAKERRHERGMKIQSTKPDGTWLSPD